MKELRDEYTLRVEDLMMLLHQQWVRGFVICAIEDMPGDPAPIPLDGRGPETEAWMKSLAEELKGMRRRKGGTWYMPNKRAG